MTLLERKTSARKNNKIYIVFGFINGGVALFYSKSNTYSHARETTSINIPPGIQQLSLVPSTFGG